MNEELFRRGEWWKQPCWNKATRKVYCPFPDEDIVEAVETLKQHFDDAWAAELAANPRMNLVFSNLCIGESTGSIGFAVYLGQMVEALVDSVGFNRLLSDLKGCKSDSALLECEAAFAFADAGFEIQFPAEGKFKSPDVLVQFGDVEVAIECKRLRDESWEDWEFRLTSKIISALPTEKDDKELVADVALHTKWTQVFMGDQGDVLNHAFVEAIVNEVSNQITRAVLNSSIPVEITIDDLASAHIQYRGEGHYGSVWDATCIRSDHPPHSPERGNASVRANSGAHTRNSIYLLQNPSRCAVKLFFDATCRTKQELLGNIMAVVLYPLQTMFRQETPLVFPNKKAKFAECRNISLGILREHFGCELC